PPSGNSSGGNQSVRRRKTGGRGRGRVTAICDHSCAWEVRRDSMMQHYQPPWMDEDLAIFRLAGSKLVETEMVPNEDRWRKQQHLDKSFWRLAGKQGFLCTDIPERYGGGGGDFRHEAVFFEEQWRRGLSGMGQGVHSITAHYILNHGTEA